MAVNSILRVAAANALLEDREMARELTDTKRIRREKLAALLDRMGQAALSEMTGIAGPYLWQMGKGEGVQQRGVSDANASKIETALSKPAGWLSTEGDEPASQPVQFDQQKMVASIDFVRALERSYKRDFLSESVALVVAAAYEYLTITEAPDRVEMAVVFGKMLEAEDERIRKVARAG